MTDTLHLSSRPSDQHERNWRRLLFQPMSIMSQTWRELHEINLFEEQKSSWNRNSSWDCSHEDYFLGSNYTGFWSCCYWDFRLFAIKSQEFDKNGHTFPSGQEVSTIAHVHVDIHHKVWICWNTSISLEGVQLVGEPPSGMPNQYEPFDQTPCIDHPPHLSGDWCTVSLSISWTAGHRLMKGLIR